MLNNIFKKKIMQIVEINEIILLMLNVNEYDDWVTLTLQKSKK